jgi:cytochrome c
VGAGGHVPTTNVPQTPIRQVIDGAADGDEHARLFRQQCVGCGSDYSRNRR